MPAVAGFFHRTLRIIHVIHVIHGRLLVAMAIQQRTLLHFSAQQVVLGIHFSIESLTAPVKLFHVPLVLRRLNSHFSTVSPVPSNGQIYNTNILRASLHSDVSFTDHHAHLHCQPCLRSRFGFHADWPCTGSEQWWWSATAMHRYAFISINLLSPWKLTVLLRCIQRNTMFRKSLTTVSRPGICLRVLFLVSREGGSDCSSIGQQAGVNPSMIQSMNPSIDCTFFRTHSRRSEAYEPSLFFVTTGNGSLSAGDPVCTKQFTPNCTLNATATSQTCNGLANTSNITTNDFVNYNSDVGCNNLTIGKPVRGAISAK